MPKESKVSGYYSFKNAGTPLVSRTSRSRANIGTGKQSTSCCFGNFSSFFFKSKKKPMMLIQLESLLSDLKMSNKSDLIHSIQSLINKKITEIDFGQVSISHVVSNAYESKENCNYSLEDFLCKLSRDLHGKKNENEFEDEFNEGTYDNIIQNSSGISKNIKMVCSNIVSVIANRLNYHIDGSYSCYK